MYKLAAAVLLFVLPSLAFAQTSLVNWENAHVHPLDMTPDGDRLLAVNTPDNRVEVFDITSGSPVLINSVPVGLDPVSVRARTNDEVWVINHISDSVSVVDLNTRNVVVTIPTLDEPADVIFAGSPERAFVSCSQANRIMVFDPNDLAAEPVVLVIEGEDPRAMAVSPDGSEVYVAIFESGNASTILSGGRQGLVFFPPNVVNDPLGPYGGVNPPPNDGKAFSPAQNPDNPPPPRVGLIAKKNAAGQWMDDNGGNWTDLVSGANADHSGRLPGWDMPDHDLAIIDADTLAIRYATGLMNTCMAVAVNPATGHVSMVGTDAINEVRYEPILSGRFIRVNAAFVDPVAPTTLGIVDLNGHLTYATSTVPQALRDMSLADPRGIVWNAAGTRGYVTGMGSNNLIIVDQSGTRSGIEATIEVGEGPTGVVLDEARNRLYVLNKFEASISALDTSLETEFLRVPLHDPTPVAIQVGRKHLYDTHKTSGLWGHTACASCHVDARWDRLAWDLGDPTGTVKEFNQNCGGGTVDDDCRDWHPMKGPMTTQTLQDIIGKEPLHWRGDRDGLEEFNGAFVSLLGDDEMLTGVEMQEFEDFLATIRFPPNPFRNLDNSLPANLALDGHFSPGRFSPLGLPLPNGNAQNGLDMYRSDSLAFLVDCVTCHSLPSGVGTEHALLGKEFVPLPEGPNGEHHHALVSVDASTNVGLKIPQLRNLYEKVGFDMTQTVNRAGFGFLHDGSVASLSRFLAQPVFNVTSDQDIADLVAFMLAFSGSDLPLGSADEALELPGPSSLDTHAAVGSQITLDGPGAGIASGSVVIDEMIALADAGAVGLVVKGMQDGIPRGYAYLGNGQFQSDRVLDKIEASALRASAWAGSELTFTVVPVGTEYRIGVDRDEDGHLDRDERDQCSDPADPDVVPPQCAPTCFVASAAVADVLGTKNGFLSFSGGDAGRSQAVRIRFADLPYPFDVWNLSEMWVGPVAQVSENGASVEPLPGFANFNAATLTCEPYYTDWSTMGVVHVLHEAIVAPWHISRPSDRPGVHRPVK